MIKLIETDFQTVADGTKVYRIVADKQFFVRGGYTIHEGTKGGYISKDVIHQESWFDELSVVTKGTYVKTHIRNSTITSNVSIIDSYIYDVDFGYTKITDCDFTAIIKDSYIKRSKVNASRISNDVSASDSQFYFSTVSNAEIKGSLIEFSEIKGHYLVNNSTVKWCILISAGTGICEIERSTVNNITKSHLNVSDAFIEGYNHLFTVDRIGSGKREFCLYTNTVDEFIITTGCFSGSVKAFERAVIERHGLFTHHSITYFKVLDLAIPQLMKNKNIKIKPKRLSVFGKIINLLKR